MGFVDFLLGAVKILVAGGIALLVGFAGAMMLTQGKMLIGGVLGAIALVAGIYVVYERGQQRKRI